MTHKPAVVAAALAATLVVLAGTVWLTASEGGRIGPVSATPSTVIVNTPTSVTFTAHIASSKAPKLNPLTVVLFRTDATGKPTDIIGRLHDDGRNGDERRGDDSYSFKLLLNEKTIGAIQFRVAARFAPTMPSAKQDDDDSDWDRDLSDLNACRGKTIWRARFERLVRRCTVYTFSDPVTVTVDPFALPPDPGEAGKATLEGIDSDHDGVRDDIQRYIAYTYTPFPETQAALRQYSIAFQHALLSSETQAASRDAKHYTYLAWDCIKHFRPSDHSQVVMSLLAEYLNTDERSRSYDLWNHQLSGMTFEALRGLESSCSFHFP